MSVDIYAFYNNKGGVGKTTLCQNVACLYAEEHPDELVLVVDLCPQANISQFLLGGGHLGYEENQRLQVSSSRRNIVGFMDWLLAGNSSFTSIPSTYTTQASLHNDKISSNVHLIAGDSFLEQLSLALNFATMNPANVNAWSEYVTAVRRLCELELRLSRYEKAKVFIDCNPSFSIYTQMALVSSDYIVIPVMADFSSLEGIKGILMLLYGKYPSAATQKYAKKFVTFSRQIANSGLSLPKLFEFPFNSFTNHRGVAAAYDSVREELIDYAYGQYKADPSIFAPCSVPPSTRKGWENLFVSDVKDFHTAGKVSASLGIPLYKMPGRQNFIMPNGEPIDVPKGNYKMALDHVKALADKII